LEISVFLRRSTCDRLWDHRRAMPPHVNINVNLSILEWAQKEMGIAEAEASFIYTVNYLPSVAQISLKGTVRVTGEKKEVDEVLDAERQKKPPLPAVFQAVMNFCTAQAVMLSQSTNVPPPIPPIQMPPAEQKTQPQKSQPYA